MARELNVRIELVPYRGRDEDVRPCYAADSENFLRNISDSDQIILPIKIPAASFGGAHEIGILGRTEVGQLAYTRFNLNGGGNHPADSLEGYFLCHEITHALGMLSLLNHQGRERFN